MDQYLHWNSNCNLPAKYIVYNTLAHRARVVCTSQPGIKQEKDDIRQALLKCNYPPLALYILHTKINHMFSTNQTHSPDSRPQTNNNNHKTKNYNIFLVVPYTKEHSESFKKVCSKLGIEIQIKGHNTFCTLLVAHHPKEWGNIPVQLHPGRL